MRRRSSVPWSLGKEELPGFLVWAKLLLESFTQLYRLSLFIRVYRRSFICALLERLESSWVHASKLDECLGPFDVYRAPNTAGFSSREPYRVPGFIKAFSNTINPAKAERLVH